MDFSMSWNQAGRAPFSKLVTGIVTENADSENKGMVTVRIPTLEDGEDLLANVRVLQPYAGAKAGFYFWPEVNDLVLVALVDGDMGRAFLLGSVYTPGGAFADGCFNEDNNLKTITSRSGIHIDLNDEKDKESLSLATPKMLAINLQDEQETITVTGEDGETSLQLDVKNGKVMLKAKEEMKLSCGKSSILLKKDGTIKLSGESITLNGKSVELSAKSKVKLSGQEISAAGQMSVKISGQSQVEVSSSGITQIKGGMLKLNG